MKVTWEEYSRMSIREKLDLGKKLLHEKKAASMIRGFFENTKVYFVLICGPTLSIKAFGGENEIPTRKEIREFAEVQKSAPFLVTGSIDNMRVEIIQ